MFRTLRQTRPRATQVLRPSIRTFTLSSCRARDAKYPSEASTDSSVKTDQYEKDKEHAVDKKEQGDHLDVQSHNVKKGMDAKGQGSGGHATQGKDSAGGKAKAKEEFPEAPDVAIGMQDERGGRGG